MSRRSLRDRLTPSWQQGGVLGVFSAVLLVLAWPTLNGRTASVVPSFQTATFPWAAQPRGLRFMWPQSDMAESAYPWAALARRTWRSGDLPLWDPHSFGGGVPWSTDGVAATLYPVRAVLDAYFLPWLAHDLFVLLHLALAGAGAYWLARRWGAGLGGATVAGVGWMTNAYVFSWAPLEMVTPFFAALPLALAATDRAVRAPSRTSVAAAAALLGFSVVAGNLAYSLIVVAACGLYVGGAVLTRLVTTRRLRDPHLARSAGAGVVVLLLGLALSAAVLVPTLLNLMQVSRQPFTFDVVRDSLLVPWSDYGHLIERPESPPPVEQLLAQYHVTPVALVLAVLGLLLARGFGAWSARVLLAVPVLIASTVPGAWVAFHFFPGFEAIRPDRLIPVALLALYILAGLGLERGWTWTTSRLARVPAWVGPVLAVAVTASVFVPAYVVARTQVPTPVEVADFPQFPRTPLIREIKEETTPTGWPVRVLQTVPSYRTDPVTTGGLIFVGGTPLVPGLDTWGGYASAVPEGTSDLLRLIAGEDSDAVLGPAPGPSITHPVYTSDSVDWALACRLGTDLLALPPAPPEGVEENWGTLGDLSDLEQVHAGSDGRLFRMPASCGSGPYLTSEAVTADSSHEAIDRLQDLGRRALDDRSGTRERTVVLPESADAPPLSSDVSGEVTTTSRDGATVSLDLTTDGPMWLVLPMSYDEGWSAHVDGEEVEVERVDFNRVGIRVGSGERQVEVSYTPPGWSLGWLLTLIAALGVLGLAVPPRRGARPTRQGASGDPAPSGARA